MVHDRNHLKNCERLGHVGSVTGPAAAVLLVLVLVAGCVSVGSPPDFAPPATPPRGPAVPGPEPATPPSSGLRTQSSFEGGTLYRTADDKFHVLQLRGTYRQMGRQYGRFLGPQIERFYTDMSSMFTAQSARHERLQVSWARRVLRDASPRLQDLFEGMAETSGMAILQLVGLNVASYALFDSFINASRCSGIGAWGSYTRDGALVFGRNWDLSRSLLEKYQKYLTVVVFNPTGGDNGVATVQFAGLVYLETGMNNRGLFVELNAGAQSDPREYSNRKATGDVLFELMAESSSLEQFGNSLSAVLADASYIIQAADDKAAYSFERPTFGIRQRSETNYQGLLVAYNSFVPPLPESWQSRVPAPPPDDPRRDNLLSLANSSKYRGKLDATNMMVILDTTIPHGGATHEGTIYQVVAVPVTSTIWLKVRGYSDWGEVKLGPLFR